MHVARPGKAAAAAALSSMVAAIAIAGPLAGTALAGKPAASVTPTLSSDLTGSVTGQTTVNFTWSTSPATSETFSCTLDGTRASCGTGTAGAKAYSALAGGVHTFVLRAKQSGHFRAVTRTVTWTVDKTPPGVPSVQQVPTPTKNSTASISFTGDATVDHFVCSVAETAPTAHVLQSESTCTSPYLVAGPLGSGSYTASVSALDATGNRSAAGTTSWVVDATAPGSPVFTQEPANPTNVTDAQFAWTSDSDVVSSTCSLDGAVASACSASKDFTGLAAGAHNFVVVDTDGVGNQNAAQVTWLIDLTPPMPPTINNGPASSTDQPSASFSFSDVEPQTTFLCSLDGSGFGGCTSPKSYPSLLDGDHDFQVEAVDAAGNASTATPYAWNIDTTPTGPALSPPAFIATPAPFTKNATASFSWLGLDDTTTGFVCKIDQGSFNVCPGPDSNGVGSTDVTVSTEGLHVFAVKATDGTNLSPASSWNWTYDKTPPPAPTFSSVPDKTSNSRTAVFAFASEAGAQFLCSLDGATATVCGNVATYTALSTADHSFAVSASDAAGNTSQSLYSWTVDLTAPAAPVLSGVGGFVSSAAADINWTDNDSTTTFTCHLDADSDQACGGTGNGTSHLSGLAEGPHTFVVTATNSSAKTAAAQISWTVDTIKPVLHLSNVPADNATTGSSAVAPTISQDEINQGSILCSLTGPDVSATCGPYSNMHDGSYTLTVQTADLAGNAADLVTTHWTVDRTPPAKPGVTGPASTTNTQPTFTFSDVDASATAFACAVDNGAFSTCASPYQVPSALALGGHSLAVTAADAVGNVSGATTYVFNVATTAPSGGPVDSTPPTATIAATTTLKGASTATFSETVQSLTAGGAALVLTGTSTVVPSNVVCLTGSTVSACNGSFNALRVTPKSALVPGQHYTVRLLANAVQDASGNALAATSLNFRGSRAEQETTPGVKTLWATGKAKAAFGGSFVRENTAGASATYTFTGTNVTWFTTTGPDQGNATVFIDGVRKAVVSNYATAAHFKVVRKYAKLANKRHTIRIVVRGVKGARAGTGTSVTVDAFRVGKKTVNTPALTTGWRSLAAKQLSGGHAAVAKLKGETLTFAFRGTGVSWVTERSRTQGKVAVFVDGVKRAVVDNYAATTKFGVKRTLTGLADKVHTLKLVVLGSHHKGGTGTWVTVDRFLVT